MEFLILKIYFLLYYYFQSIYVREIIYYYFLIYSNFLVNFLRKKLNICIINSIFFFRIIYIKWFPIFKILLYIQYCTVSYFKGICCNDMLYVLGIKWYLYLYNPNSKLVFVKICCQFVYSCLGIFWDWKRIRVIRARIWFDLLTIIMIRIRTKN